MQLMMPNHFGMDGSVNIDIQFHQCHQILSIYYSCLYIYIDGFILDYVELHIIYTSFMGFRSVTVNMILTWHRIINYFMMASLSEFKTDDCISCFL